MGLKNRKQRQVYRTGPSWSDEIQSRASKVVLLLVLVGVLDTNSRVTGSLLKRGDVNENVNATEWECSARRRLIDAVLCDELRAGGCCEGRARRH